jgi:Tol biopolymer transport system component
VAFESVATNLTADDTNGAIKDIFVRDRNTNETTRVSVSYNGDPVNSASSAPSISSDGSYVAFESTATNLTADDTNGAIKDIFVRDRNTNETTRVSVSYNGDPVNGASSAPSISSDGRYVAFESLANNLVTGDTNGVKDIFVYDRNTGTTTLVSVDSSGLQGNGISSAPSISSDGGFVVFESLANNLVTGDANGVKDIFVYDRNTGTTTLVSVDSSGLQGNGISSAPSISSDGRFVVFESLANNLVTGDTKGVKDIFVYDRNTGTTIRVSVDSSGFQGDGASSVPSVSSDGKHVTFESIATNLVTDDTNGLRDIFVNGP